MSGSWFDQLQPASFRGVGFAVTTSTIKRGRQTATHVYPFRDYVWVEDLGRGVRSIAFAAFLVGDDCFAQRDALLAAAETAGAGDLIHPSLGSLTVTLISPIETREGVQQGGRVVEFTFEAIESSDPTYPDADDDTGDAVSDAADDADTASTSDFLSGIGDAVAEGAQVVAAGVSAAESFVSQVSTLVGDASLITHAVAGLPGNLGRYASGARSTLLAGISTVDGAIAAVTTARAAATAAGNTVATLAEGL